MMPSLVCSNALEVFPCTLSPLLTDGALLTRSQPPSRHLLQRRRPPRLPTAGAHPHPVVALESVEVGVVAVGAMTGTLLPVLHAMPPTPKGVRVATGGIVAPGLETVAVAGAVVVAVVEGMAIATRATASSTLLTFMPFAVVILLRR
jgi:hypothetical protein